MHIHPNHLLQIIKLLRTQKFSDYKNEQRVNDVKKVLASNNVKTTVYLASLMNAGIIPVPLLTAPLKSLLVARQPGSGKNVLTFI